MKELLQRYKAESRWEVYSILKRIYFNGYKHSAKSEFKKMNTNEQALFIASMSVYDPAYTFFSTMNFAETV